MTLRTRGRRPTRRGTGATWCDDIVVVTYGASCGGGASPVAGTATMGDPRWAGGLVGVTTGSGRDDDRRLRRTAVLAGRRVDGSTRAVGGAGGRTIGVSTTGSDVTVASSVAGTAARRRR